MSAFVMFNEGMKKCPFCKNIMLVPLWTYCDKKECYRKYQHLKWLKKKNKTATTRATVV